MKNRIDITRVYKAMALQSIPPIDKNTEIARLTACLKTANASAEEFERKWYLKCDEIEAMQQDGVPPDGGVLVPYDPSTPTPDYAECARQATLATGLPSQYPGSWLCAFIREINRWCQHSNQSVVNRRPPSGLVDSSEFIKRTNEDYSEWCGSYYQADTLDERGMASLHGLWAWQEQERRKYRQPKKDSI